MKIMTYDNIWRRPGQLQKMVRIGMVEILQSEPLLKAAATVASSHIAGFVDPVIEEWTEMEGYYPGVIRSFLSY